MTGRVTSAAARRWPRTASGLLRWRLTRHDRAVAARRARALGAPGAGSFGANWEMKERELSHLAAFIESGAELNAYDSTSWLPTLHIPAAVLVTARDSVVAPWRQEAMAALVPGAKRYLVDAGHDAVVAKPDVFLPVLAQACADLAR